MPTEAFPLVEKLTAVLNDAGRISKSEAAEAIALIKTHLHRTNLRLSGDCFNCGQPGVEYGSPSVTHQQRGDKWLAEIARRWHFPMKVVLDWRGCLVNGYRRDNISRYLCDSCKAEVAALHQQAEQQNVERREMAREQYQVDLHAIFRGEKWASPYRRYEAACLLTTAVD